MALLMMLKSMHREEKSRPRSATAATAIAVVEKSATAAADESDEPKRNAGPAVSEHTYK